MKAQRAVAGHVVGMVAAFAIALLSTELYESRGMSPNGLGWTLILSACFVAYFYISTHLIQLQPIGVGEKIRTDGVTEIAELERSMHQLLKNIEALNREKSRDWQCSSCNEPNGEAFEICWNCSTERKTGTCTSSNGR